MTGFWSFCMTQTYVMLNPQCDVTGNTRMVACDRHICHVTGSDVTKCTHSRVVGLKLEGNLVLLRIRLICIIHPNLHVRLAPTRHAELPTGVHGGPSSIRSHRLPQRACCHIAMIDRLSCHAWIWELSINGHRCWQWRSKGFQFKEWG